MAVIQLLVAFLALTNGFVFQRTRPSVVSSRVSVDMSINSNGFPKTAGQVEASKRVGALLSVAPALFSSLLLPKLVNARSSSAASVKEATPAFVEDKAKALKFEADAKRIRSQWDGLLVKLEGSQTPEELQGTLRDMRKLLIAMPYQIPYGSKKSDLVKTARQQKFLKPGSKSKKTKPSWTTPVEIEYQALIQQWNKNFNPDNRAEESIF